MPTLLRPGVRTTQAAQQPSRIHVLRGRMLILGNRIANPADRQDVEATPLQQRLQSSMQQRGFPSSGLGVEDDDLVGDGEGEKFPCLYLAGVEAVSVGQAKGLRADVGFSRRRQIRHDHNAPYTGRTELRQTRSRSPSRP